MCVLPLSEKHVENSGLFFKMLIYLWARVASHLIKELYTKFIGLELPFLLTHMHTHTPCRMLQLSSLHTMTHILLIPTLFTRTRTGNIDNVPKRQRRHA